MANFEKRLKNKVFVFTDSTCIELVNPPNLESFAEKPLCVINPDLGAVEGLERHFWKLEEGKVLPMNQHERNMRKRLHELMADNKVAQDHFATEVVALAKAQAEAEQKAQEAASTQMLLELDARARKDARNKVIKRVAVGGLVAGAAAAAKYFGLV